MTQLLNKCRTRLPFATGQVVITSNAASLLNHDEIYRAFRRHVSGDWGSICPEDAKANDDALVHGDRLLSVYGESDRQFWIITDSGRSVTTILLPEDY
jgi:hypothetical protein